MRIDFNQIEGDWQLDPEQLSALFGIYGWSYANRTLGFGVPKPDRIEQILKELAVEVFQGKADFVERGRFLVRRYPNSYAVDVYLNVGTYWPADDDEDLEGDEEFEE